MYFGCFLAAIIYHFVQVILKEESENERTEMEQEREKKRERDTDENRTRKLDEFCRLVCMYAHIVNMVIVSVC